MAIYLFKAARRPTYRRENLHLLAADRGTVVDMQYRLSWVAPEYFEPGSIRRGEQVNVVLTDRPYDRFVPIRAGEVFDVIRGDGVLRLRVLLNNWIGLPTDVAVQDFARIVKQTHPEKAPRHKFLAPKLDRVPFVEYYDERENDGWCRAIDEVCAMSAASEDRPYAASVFFRALGVRLAGENVPVSVRTRALEAGASGTLDLRFYNPHLNAEDLATLHLEASAVGDVEIQTPQVIPADGVVALPIDVRAADGEALLQVGPSVTQHTHVVERFSGIRRTQPPGINADDRRRDLLDLIASVLRNADFKTAGDRLDFWQLAARMLPDEAVVGEQRAVACNDLGDHRKALEILRALPQGELSDPATLLLWKLELGEKDDAGIADRAQTLGLLDDSRFRDFVEAIEVMEPRRLAAFVPRLVELAPADDTLRELVDRVATRMTSTRALVAVANTICYNGEDPRWAYDFLRERRDSLHLADPEVHDQLWDFLGLGGADEFDPAMEIDEKRRLTNLIQRDEFDSVRRRLDKLAKGKVPGRRRLRDRLFHLAADQLDGKGRAEDAAHVLVSLATHACTTGDLQTANDAVQRAIGLWCTRPNANGASGIPEWLTLTRDNVQSAWQQVDGLEDWRRSDEERQRETLRKQWLNKRVLVAGGTRNEGLVEYVEHMTGASVDWCERYRKEGSDMKAFEQRLQNGQYAMVIHMLRQTGHETGDQLKRAAEKGGARWAQAAGTGRASVLACLSGRHSTSIAG